jgi:alpha,alpha-trehalose phosphorylase
MLDTANLIDFERALDLRAGALDRQVRFETADGKELAVHSRRFVSLEHRHLAAIVYEVHAHRGTIRLVLSSELVVPSPSGHGGSDDPRGSRRLAEHVLEVSDQRTHHMRILLNLHTRSSGLRMACGIDHEFACDADVHVEPAEAVEDRARVVFLTRLEAGQKLRVVKWMSYHHSLRSGRADPVDAGELRFRANRTLDAARRADRCCLAEQREQLDATGRAGVRSRRSRSHQTSAQPVPDPPGHRAGARGVPSKGLFGLGLTTILLGHRDHVLRFWSTPSRTWPALLKLAK